MLERHNEAQRLSSKAALLLSGGERELAYELFSRAAVLEREALDQLPATKMRTRGILAVSFVSQLYKGKQYVAARTAVHQLLATPETLPDFAVAQLYESLDLISDELQLAGAGREYADRSLDIRLIGGEVYQGSAPADVAINQMNGWHALVVRVAEYIGNFKSRVRGLPESELFRYVAPRITTPAAGSFRFSVRLAVPLQTHFMFPVIEAESAPLFRHGLDADRVVAETIELVKILADGDAELLQHHINDRDYRRTIAGLVRGVTPVGQRLTQVKVSAVSAEGTSEPVSLSKSTRKLLDETLRSDLPPAATGDQILTMVGNLRAAHLDAHWVILKTKERSAEMKLDKGIANDVLGPLLDHDVEALVRIQGDSMTLIDATLIDQ
jgi:hypothetical protein